MCYYYIWRNKYVLGASKLQTGKKSSSYKCVRRCYKVIQCTYLYNVASAN